MDEVIRETLDGVLAHVWLDFDSDGVNSPSLPGYIRHGDQLGIHLLKPNRNLRDFARDVSFPQTTPNTLVAASEVSMCGFRTCLTVRLQDIFDGFGLRLCWR